eukprot:Gb_01231 [translate_table: standard]
MAHLPSVPRLCLGSQGFEVSAQGLGCMGMNAFYGPPKSEEEMIHLIRYAVSKGVTFLDTSDVYGPFTNEVLVGKAIKGIRDKVQLATKFGITFADNTMSAKGDPAYVRAACEGSLKRLDVDCIDLYYQHRIDTKVPIEATQNWQCILSAYVDVILPKQQQIAEYPFQSRDCIKIKSLNHDQAWIFLFVESEIGELKKLVEEGKIKYIGLSEASASTIRRAHAVHPITAVQIEWSLWSRDVEEKIIPTCRELGIGIVPYSPLGRGFFSSGAKLAENLTDTDYRKFLPRFTAENLERNQAIFHKLSEISSRKGCTPGQLALAWVHHQGKDVSPIPGPLCKFVSLPLSAVLLAAPPLLGAPPSSTVALNSANQPLYQTLGLSLGLFSPSFPNQPTTGPFFLFIASQRPCYPLLLVSTLLPTARICCPLFLGCVPFFPFHLHGMLVRFISFPSTVALLLGFPLFPHSSRALFSLLSASLQICSVLFHALFQNSGPYFLSFFPLFCPLWSCSLFLLLSNKICLLCAKLG